MKVKVGLGAYHFPSKEKPGFLLGMAKSTNVFISTRYKFLYSLQSTVLVNKPVVHTVQLEGFRWSPVNQSRGISIYVV